MRYFAQSPRFLETFSMCTLLIVLGGVLVYFSLHKHLMVPVSGYEYSPLSLVPETLTLYSETVPELIPHVHEDLDSIIDDDHGEIVHLRNGVYVTDRDLWVTKIAWVVENAPQATLHHFIFTRQDKAAELCPNGFSQYKEILTAGSDTTTNELVFPDSYALHIPRGTPLDLETIFHNPLPPFGPGGSYKDVRMRLVLTLGSQTEYQPLEIVRLSLEDPACDSRSSTFDVPAETTSFIQSTDSPISSYTFTHESLLLLIGAHTHGWDGGKNVKVFLNDKKLEDFIPRRTTPDPWSWVTPTKRMGVRVREGDIITFTAEYSNPHDAPLVREAMGMIMLMFSPIETDKSD